MFYISNPSILLLCKSIRFLSHAITFLIDWLILFRFLDFLYRSLSLSFSCKCCARQFLTRSRKRKGGRMWFEARKQEKLIRGMMVDYKRRAERRKGFYDKIVNKIVKWECAIVVYCLLRNIYLEIRKKIRPNFCKCGADHARYTRIRALRPLPTILLLCKRWWCEIMFKWCEFLM